MYLLRSAFGHFLWEVYRKGSVAAWWHDYRAGTWSKYTSSAWGILFIYLLDRRLIHLSYDELLQLKPILNKGYPGMTRLWRNRLPEEYQQFLQAMMATNYQDSKSKETALRVLCLFILLKYGLNGVTELGRSLTSEEIQQVCRERRLITWHIRSGIFLPYPLTEDNRVGHVILDDIRWYFWRYSANHFQKSSQKSWNIGPYNWPMHSVNIIEQTLAAPMFEQAKGIISRRPETERIVINPLSISYTRDVPNEEIMDRVFRDGVCNLTYDVFSRLALTIQYYCGTRVSETLDLHLFCVLQDQQHAVLLIPKGKTKQERPFPLVKPGMEYLEVYIGRSLHLLRPHS